MYVPFSHLPANARLWIYGINKTLNEQERSAIKEDLTAFLTQWTAHQQSLEASFLIPYDAFIVIALNENKTTASGCSIDTSIHFLQQLEKKYSIALFDRMQVAIKHSDTIERHSLAAFKEQVKVGICTKETVVFNNLVNTKEAFESSWETPAYLSWHKRFFE